MRAAAGGEADARRCRAAEEQFRHSEHAAAARQGDHSGQGCQATPGTGPPSSVLYYEQKLPRIDLFSGQDCWFRLCRGSLNQRTRSKDVGDDLVGALDPLCLDGPLDGADMRLGEPSPVNADETIEDIVRRCRRVLLQPSI